MEIGNPYYKRILLTLSAVFFLVIIFNGCTAGCPQEVTSVEIVKNKDNALRETFKIVTKDTTTVFVRYWQKGHKTVVWQSSVSKHQRIHFPVLFYLKPATDYAFEVVAKSATCQSVSATQTFSTGELPIGLVDLFSVQAADSAQLPTRFKEGYALVSRRDLPGIAAIINAKGKIAWYNELSNTGYKVAHFTKNGSVLSILGPLSFPTSYGNEILDQSLSGDTLFHLRLGEKGFDKTIHHEILWDQHQHLVTLTLEKKVVDLSSVGGLVQDTVVGDGILVLDKKGNKVWQWSVFDVLDPKSDPDILKNKADWLHANSLCIDQDWNYIISFYHSGQIWKIDAHTGRLIWKMGRGSAFTFTGKAVRAFHESHAVHFTKEHHLLLFENGLDVQRSRVLSYQLDEQNHSAKERTAITLPKDLYSMRMGSAYRITDSTILVCSSQQMALALVTSTGQIIWRCRLGFIPYRAEFIDRQSFYSIPN